MDDECITYHPSILVIDQYFSFVLLAFCEGK